MTRVPLGPLICSKLTKLLGVDGNEKGEAFQSKSQPNVLAGMSNLGYNNYNEHRVAEIWQGHNIFC